MKTFNSSDWAMVFLIVLVLALFVGQATGVLPTKSDPTKTTMTWDTLTAKSYSVTKTKTSPQQPLNKIAVSSITWCGHEYTLQEWQDVKSGYWQGKCPERVE